MIAKEYHYQDLPSEFEIYNEQFQLETEIMKVFFFCVSFIINLKLSILLNEKGVDIENKNCI
jgi:hypothetical protein